MHNWVLGLGRIDNAPLEQNRTGGVVADEEQERAVHDEDPGRGYHRASAHGHPGRSRGRRPLFIDGDDRLVDAMRIGDPANQSTAWRAIGATPARAADAISTATYLDQIARPSLAVQAVDVLG